MRHTMSLSKREIEHQKEKAWRNRAKGRGVRWRMIRDTLATVSVYWLTIWEVQTCMIRIWGLTRNKTREILEEMVETSDVETKKDPTSHNLLYKLRQDRLVFWLGAKRSEAIPAGIAQVVETTMLASKSEV